MFNSKLPEMEREMRLNLFGLVLAFHAKHFDGTVIHSYHEISYEFNSHGIAKYTGGKIEIRRLQD